jgi:Family of unknown function (DUF6228)
MSDRVTIKCARSSAVLEFYAAEPSGSFHALLRGEGFTGTVDVYEYEPPLRLAAFFRDLATHWRGWSGEKRWASLESQLTLRATSDSTGHTHLIVHLVGGPCHDWRLVGWLTIEAGQLETIAVEIERFVRVSHAA